MNAGVGNGFGGAGGSLPTQGTAGASGTGISAQVAAAREALAAEQRKLEMLEQQEKLAVTQGGVAGVLPPGWVRQWDMTRQAFFYINSNVQPPHMQWDPPPAPAGLPAAPGSAAAQGVQSAASAAGGLSGWWSRLVHGSGSGVPAAASSSSPASTALVAVAPVAGAGGSGPLAGVGVGVASAELNPPGKLLSNAVIGAAGFSYRLCAWVCVRACVRTYVHMGLPACLPVCGSTDFAVFLQHRAAHHLSHRDARARRRPLRHPCAYKRAPIPSGRAEDLELHLPRCR